MNKLEMKNRTEKKEEVKQEFEVWLENQPEEVKTLIQERFQSLENTVRAVRQERDSFHSELKNLGSKLEAGSEAELKLKELSDKLTKSEKKSLFLESAAKENCLRPAVAYSLATSENLFDADGNPDWKRIKESVPELFKVTNTKTNAGAGTNHPVAKEDPNLAIRQAAGRQPR